MTITKSQNGTNLTFCLEGRLDTVTAPEFEAEIKALPDEIESLTLDLKTLEYISSAGLRVLLAAHKAMSTKNGMQVKNVGEVVAEVFEVTGFSDILDIE